MSETTRFGVRWRRPSGALEGALLMVFSCACFAAMSALIRHLSDNLSSFEIAFFRNAVGLVALLPWMAHLGLGRFKTQRLKLYLSRGTLGVVAMWAWYAALGMMPLAEAITLNFTVALWMIPVAIVLLKERIGPSARRARHRTRLRAHPASAPAAQARRRA